MTSIRRSLFSLALLVIWAVRLVAPPDAAAHHAGNLFNGFISPNDGLYHWGYDTPCSSSDYLFLGHIWPTGVYTYWTTPELNWPNGELGRDQVLQGHLAWNYTINPCGQPDTSPFAGWWAGSRSDVTLNPNDGINIREMNPIAPAGCPGNFAACTVTQQGNGKTNGSVNAADSDIRFNSGITWHATWGSNTGGLTDLQSVATHEAGHSMGLDDLSPPPGPIFNVQEDLSMFGWAAGPDARARNLGWGDYTGMQALYP